MSDEKTTTAVEASATEQSLNLNETPRKDRSMALDWKYSLENIDWDELSALYLAAPMGYKAPADLQVAFSNSMFKCVVYDSGRLIATGRALADGRDCSFLCDIAVHIVQKRKLIRSSAG